MCAAIQFVSSIQLLIPPKLHPDSTLSKNERFLLVCASGRRSLAVAQTLQARGFTDVVSLTGGAAGLLAHQQPA